MKLPLPPYFPYRIPNTVMREERHILSLCDDLYEANAAVVTKFAKAYDEAELFTLLSSYVDFPINDLEELSRIELEKYSEEERISIRLPISLMLSGMFLTGFGLAQLLGGILEGVGFLGIGVILLMMVLIPRFTPS